MVAVQNAPPPRNMKPYHCLTGLTVACAISAICCIFSKDKAHLIRHNSPWTRAKENDHLAIGDHYSEHCICTTTVVGYFHIAPVAASTPIPIIPPASRFPAFMASYFASTICVPCALPFFDLHDTVREPLDFSTLAVAGAVITDAPSLLVSVHMTVPCSSQPVVFTFIAWSLPSIIVAQPPRDARMVMTALMVIVLLNLITPSPCFNS